jgi:hypothetical protein
VQTELTTARRSHQDELGRVNQQIAGLTRETEQLRAVKSDYDVLEQLIDENPDLAEQLFERAGKMRPRAGRAAAPTPGAPAGASPEVLQELKQLRSMVEQDRSGRTEAEKQARMSQTDQQLGEQLKGLLTEHELDEAWLPSAREYVLSVARRYPQLDMAEVPYVFAEWARPLQERLSKQLTTWRNGKLEDQRVLPPMPGGSGQAVVAGANGKGALDRNTKAILEERLKSALGWKNE